MPKKDADLVGYSISHPSGKWARGSAKPLPVDKAAKQERLRFSGVAQLKASRTERLAFRRARRQLMWIRDVFQCEAADEESLRPHLVGIHSIQAAAERQRNQGYALASADEVYDVAQELLDCYLDGRWPMPTTEHISKYSPEHTSRFQDQHEKNQRGSTGIGNTPPSWHPKKPKREQCYNVPLYEYLKTAHANGALSPPTPADLLSHWLDNPPPGYGIRVSEDLQQLFYDGYGNISERKADRKALQQAIRRMVSHKKPV